MNRSTLARRYAPLAALAAIQLLIIATVPSTASKQARTQISAGSGFNAGSSGSSGSTSGGGGSSSGGGSGGTVSAGGGGGSSGGGSSSGGGGSGSSGGGSTSGGGGGGGGSASAPPGVGSGDTSHCVGGREFSTAIAYWAPPCVPGKPGATGIDNGGATAQGVTANSITLVDYNGDPGAEVDAILRAQGLYESYQNAQVLDAAYQNFINKYYVLSGRKLNIITYQGQCTTVPPDTNCLIPEMDKIAAKYHPYAVYWNTTLCSACFAELARDKVVTIGGVGFSDEFANANAPYFYSVSESSSRIEKEFAEFYCKQLAHSPVKFAGTQNPAQNFNGKPRVLGIISTNDPDNKNTVMNVLVPALKSQCNVDVNHFYFYAQDINTAAQQTQAGIAAMDTPSNPATIVLCLCDAVAPQFLYGPGEKQNNYWPENVLASDQGMDLDKAAQSYDSTTLACAPGPPCEFDNAFGINPNGPAQPSSNDEGTRMYALGGGTNLPVDATINQVVAEDYVMFANLLENTGPNLTPENMQARAPDLGTISAPDQALLQFTPGSWGWQKDTRVAFWSKDTKSSFNGAPGTYITIEGPGRYGLGQYPTVDEPPIPTPRP